MKNERGASLVLVLLISLIFITLGLSILSVSLGGTKRTTIRENDVITSQDAIVEMTKVLSDFRKEVNNVSLKKRSDLTNGIYQTELQQIIDGLPIKLSERYKDRSTTKPMLLVSDETSNYLSDASYKTKYYTRVLLFKIDYYGKYNSSTPELKKSISRRLYLSPTPSFLQYAVGAKNNLNLNGASDLVGNIYGSNINILNQANYMDALTPINSESHADTPYPYIRGSLVIDNALQLLKRNQPQGVTYGSLKLPLLTQGMVSEYFYQNKVPIIKKPDENFVNMDFKQTLYDKLDLILPTKMNENDPLDLSIGDKIVDGIFQDAKFDPTQESVLGLNAASTSHQYVIEKDTNPSDITLKIPAGKKVVLMTDLPDAQGNSIHSDSPFIIKDHLNLEEDQWLIVDGDLEIYNRNNGNENPINIQGNIVVLGNVSIHGFDNDTAEEKDKIQFNTAMYVLGNSSIYSTNITGLDGKQLVLLSKGDLLVNRTNEFSRVDENVVPLKAFLYTDGEATLYGVGSAISINGGIFANHNLTINSIRQNIVTTRGPNALDIDSESMQNNQASRFSVIYDKTILLNQLESLPTVDSLRIIMDHYTFSK